MRKQGAWLWPLSWSLSQSIYYFGGCSKQLEKVFIKGFEVGRNLIIIALLQLADDTIFFARAKVDRISNNKHFLLSLWSFNGS